MEKSAKSAELSVALHCMNMHASLVGCSSQFSVIFHTGSQIYEVPDGIIFFLMLALDIFVGISTS